MEIIKNLEGTTLNIALVGRLDTVTAPDFEAAISDSLSNVKELYIDFSKLEYVSSAGLRVLLSTQKTMNKQGKMVIRNVSQDVMDVFEITGFIDILAIE